MSSLDGEDLFASLSFQQAEISAYMNSTIVQIFLMGIYTIVYGLTIFLYIHRQASYRWVIVCVITVLYLSSLATGGLYWYQTNVAVLESGNTMLDTFNSIYNLPQWLCAMTDLCENIVISLADGLLMWRCYMIWNGSRRIIWLPCGLWFAEVALAVTDSVIDFYNLSTSSDSQINIGDQVSAAQFFTSAATSVVSTYLIAHRIYAASCRSSSSKKMFRNILNIVIESAAVYTVCVIVLGIFFAIPDPTTIAGSLLMDTAMNYTTTVAWALIGLMPTLMVARVALSSGRETSLSSTLDAPSKIIFRSHGGDLRQSWSVNYSNNCLDDGHWKQGSGDVV